MNTADRLAEEVKADPPQMASGGRRYNTTDPTSQPLRCFSFHGSKHSFLKNLWRFQVPIRAAALVFFLVLSIPSIAMTQAKQVRPKLIMQNGWIFDMECQTKTGFKIDPAWQMEALEKENKFQNAWDKNASALILNAEETVGRDFPRLEYDVTLSVCNFVPMARPFIMTVKLYLDSYAKSTGKEKWPLDAFVSLTYHELIHHLIDNTENLEFREFSALCKKYKNENPNVLAHIHLMAVQKSVYAVLGRKDLMDETNKIYAYIGGDYARAWEIVEIEGTVPFVAELKAWNKKVG